jgi:parallel beta-helix repeat protein
MGVSPFRCAASLVLAAALGAAPSAPAGAKPKLPSRTVQCGEVLTESLRVANNLLDCPADGLVVGAPGITIDLGGHRIDGTSAAGSAGIDNSAGHDDVVIENGVLNEFEDGVRLEGASGNTVRLLRAQRILGAGIHLVTSSGNLLQQNQLSRSDDFGFHFEPGCNDNVVSGNEVSGSQSSGLFIEGSSANQFLSNVVWANDYGMEIFGSDHVVRGNVVEANRDHGIVIDGAPTGVLVKGNRSSGNDGNGIQVFGAGSNNLLVGNTTHENGGHGIESESSAITLKKNKANGNGFLGGGSGDDVGLGLSVPAGAANSGNKALGNDDPNECEASDLGCHVP